MELDQEGYSCKRAAGGAWWIIDRFGDLVAGHLPLSAYDDARRYADQLNDGVIARRFGRDAPPPAVRAPEGRPAPRLKPTKTALPSFDVALAALDLF